MSYPPDHHLLRDLTLRGTHTREVAVNRATVTSGLRADDAVRLGVLATLVDVTGAGIALAAIQPDWIATADLAVHILRPVRGGTVAVECRPLRVGKRQVVVDAELHDEEGHLCGTGRMAFARIPGSATAATVAATDDSGPVEFSVDGGQPIERPIVEQCGMEVVGPGQLRFEKLGYVCNSFGSVNGGVLALAAEAAAVSATGGGTSTDLHIHYLEQVGAGPVGVTAEVVRPGDDTSLCLVRIVDRAADRTVAVADALVAHSGPHGVS